MHGGVMRRFAVVGALLVLAGGCGQEASTTSTPPTISTPSIVTAPIEAPTTSVSRPTTRTAALATTSTSSPGSTTVPPAPTTTTTVPEYVSVLTGGMSCQDFATVELGFESALGYWLVNGRPPALDSDGDGLPCEHTKFPLDLPACCGEEPPDSWVPGDDPFFSGGEWVTTGMLCRDLVDEFDHPDYGFALAYWLWDGEPDRMDADRDGIPCETVYPAEFIRDVLEDPGVITVDPWNMTTDDLPPGMLCREAIWWRPFYRQVLGYYFSEGLPDQMDADLDGIPCETVYEEAESYGEWELENMPPDLSCEDLAKDRWYPRAIAYYLAYGQPAQLDPDGDGYPCSPGWPDPDDVQYFKDGSPGCCAG